jgi:N-acetylneuraminate synthase
MIEETRILERSPGSPDKFIIAENETQTAIPQRRCLRAARDIRSGMIPAMIDVLRPATPGAIKPDQITEVIGRKALTGLPFGKELNWTDLG